MEKSRYAVFICRLQPTHIGHYAVIAHALQVAERLIVVLGSAGSSRSLKNPFSVQERETLLRAALTPAQNDRVIVTGVQDHRYNLNKWITEVQETVDYAIDHDKWSPDPVGKIFLVGHSKDASSFYLKMFPEYDSVNVEGHPMISATAYRHSLFAHRAVPQHDTFLVNQAEREAMQEIVAQDEFQALFDDYYALDAYKGRWWPKTSDGIPIKGQYVTVDAAVTCAGHLLMVKRGGFPSIGQWALPGGFLNTDEEIFDACLRELGEETLIEVPREVFAGSLVSKMVADDVDRDPRGRVISHAFRFDLDRPIIGLPEIVGSDDATHADWIPLSEVKKMRSIMFSDHYDILEALNIL